MKKYLILILLFFSTADAVTMANPAFLTSKGVLSIGASYHLGGYTLTNEEVSSLFNRYQLHLELSPLSFMALGVSAGTIQIDVDSFSVANTTYGIFRSNYGYCAGGTLKLASPFLFNDLIALITQAQGSLFKSQNDSDAFYMGYEGCGIIGAQFKIKKHGFISAGAQVYLIDGENGYENGSTSYYSNVNNVRGWIAFDFLPPASATKVAVDNYISVEFTVSPEIAFGERIPVKEFGFSVSIGAQTPALWGKR